MQALYEQHRGLLFRLAYQMTGSAADAEDAVQDVFVKAHAVRLEELEEPKAYLCRMVTNRCLDMMKSARKQREQYFGEWLPEPIRTEQGDLADAVIRGELLSYAMLVLLERLTPGERAVFVLREAFGFDYAAIVGLVDKSEANCRKIYSRARTRMGIAEDAPVRTEESGEAWMQRLTAALAQGQADAVVSLLAEDVVLISDGGGKVLSAVHPIVSAARVAQFMVGLVQKAAMAGVAVQTELLQVNGQPAVRMRMGDEVTLALLHAGPDAIRGIYLVRNPDKLAAV